MPNLESACSCRIECFASHNTHSGCKIWLTLWMYMWFSATQEYPKSCNDNPSLLSYFVKNLGQDSKPEGCRSGALKSAVDCALM